MIVADAGLGAINSVTLTAEYLRSREIAVRGVILNRYAGGTMQDDNVKMIEEIANVPVLALVRPRAEEIDTDGCKLAALYE